jgi:TPP-dependent indolepyruvate ferredoxin oxidoreductase alpha subunit
MQAIQWLTPTKNIKVKKSKKPVTYILPAYWACALINADESGMEESDIKDLNNFLESEKPGFCVGCSEEQYFSHDNDATNLGGDVLEYYFRKS